MLRFGGPKMRVDNGSFQMMIAFMILFVPILVFFDSGIHRFVNFLMFGQIPCIAVVLPFLGYLYLSYRKLELGYLQ